MEPNMISLECQNGCHADCDSLLTKFVDGTEIPCECHCHMALFIDESQLSAAEE